MLNGEALSQPYLLLAILVPLVSSPLTFLVGRVFSWRAGAVLCHATTLVSFLIIISFFPGILEGRAFYEEYPWVPLYGITLGLVLDSLSYPFALLMSLMGLLASVYSHKYMEREHGVEAYFAMMQLFHAGMLGVVLVSNLFLFYIFWEVMLIPSYVLIAYWGTGNPRVIGFKYFVFTHAGALALLIGIAWLAALFNNLNIFELADLASGAAAELRPVLTTIALLIFLGAAVKMAIFPFHSWLPDAHAEAPTPISVLLSGVMIKSGVYAFARLVMGIMPFTLAVIGYAISILAVLSILWGGIMAMVQNDVKRVLAYSSISQMGYILFGVATADPVGVQGGLFQVLNHGFAKGLLFMAAGVIIHELNERDLRKLGGLASKMPVTAIAMILGGLAVAGTPPLGIFMSEWMIFAGGISAGFTTLTIIAIFATAITAGYYLRIIRAIFYGEKTPEAREGPLQMLTPMAVLIFLVVAMGFLHTPILAILSKAAETLTL